MTLGVFDANARIKCIRIMQVQKKSAGDVEGSVLW